MSDYVAEVWQNQPLWEVPGAASINWLIFVLNKLPTKVTNTFQLSLTLPNFNGIEKDPALYRCMPETERTRV